MMVGSPLSLSMVDGVDFAPQLSQLQPGEWHMLESLIIPSQHFPHLPHQLLSQRNVSWSLDANRILALACPLPLILTVEPVHPFHKIIAHVHVLPHLLLLLLVLLESHQQTVDAAQVVILPIGNLPHMLLDLQKKLPPSRTEAKFAEKHCEH